MTEIAGTFRMDQSTIPLSRVVVGPLRPCPFCGDAATVETSPWLAESVRIACGNDACGVQPRTEYLLVRYAGELSAAWNGRAAADAAAEDAA